MYHSRIDFCLIGLSDEASALMKAAQPCPAFEHHFVQIDAPHTESINQASVVIADITHADAAAWCEVISKALGTQTHFIVMGAGNQIPALEPYFDCISDIWPAPESPTELIFRFHRLQKVLKRVLDAWESNQFLEATINSIPSLVWYKSADGIHHKVNDAFCSTVGKTKEQVQGQGHAYIWDVEADDPACIESERQVMETETTVVAEEAIETGEGPRLLTTYKSPLYNWDGSVMGTVGVGLDITQERAYEEEIVEKNRTLETIFTSMDCGVITHSLDGKRVVSVNQAALNILGYETLDEMMDKGFDMVARSVVREDAERMREAMKGLKHVGDTISTDYTVCHDNGDILHVMGNVKLIENDGERLYQRFLLDYTDKKNEEDEKDRRQRNLIHALSEDYLLACSFNLDTGEGEALRVSRDRARDLEPIFSDPITLEGALGAYIENVVCEEDQAMLRRSLSRKNLLEELADDERIHINYRIHRGDSVEYCQATVVRTGDWKNSREVVLGLRSVDTQTREEMKKKTLLEDALNEANRANAAKSAFLSNMSHDIRTPMNAIVGFTTLAESRIEQPEKVQEYLEKIKSSSTHLLSLINDILDMSHIESGKVSLDEQPYNLKILLEDLYSIIQAETSARQLYFTIDTEGICHEEVRCDKLRINQILLNLIGNALKFTNPGGFVKVKVDELKGAPAGYGRFRFTVSDTGIGMSPEFVEHIFDAFERERTSTISGIQGTGLGMTITKNLVDMMHGTIAVESEKGKGTTFTVELTLQLAGKDAGDAKDTPKTVHLDPNHRMHGSRILLVDDNDLNREIAITLLEDEGFSVEYAVNGKEGINTLVAAGPGHFQLILMDIQMPEMNGYEATKAIRKLDDPTLATIPILAMTADAFEEDRQKALRCGMDGHLTKPIELEKLFEALDLILA